MNIPEAAQASGLTSRTVRCHEDIGLVAPQRGPNGYRHFSPADIHRLRFLSRAQAARQASCRQGLRSSSLPG
ncbi:MerR family transcriptional regulator [Paracoccus shandongensis]|uniref:MerR family transcriptional regulator n=1 Tax=Paracoccus shandongensis TaxID=2816048 RepID=UPI001A8F077D|nr:MerR family transcriptional regulator [Paracoccus shandongensis]